MTEYAAFNLYGAREFRWYFLLYRYYVLLAQKSTEHNKVIHEILLFILEGFLKSTVILVALYNTAHYQGRNFPVIKWNFSVFYLKLESNYK